MKKRNDDFDEIIDDELIDEDEIVDDEVVDEIEDEPVKTTKKVSKGKPSVKKKGLPKGAKIAIISSSSVVGVIAIALVVLLVILPLVGINIFTKKSKYDGPSVTADLYYDATASYGLYFYGDNHNVTGYTSTSDISTAIGTVDMVRATTSLSTKYFDPSKPTVVWFHGWESTGSVGDLYLTVGDSTHKAMPSYSISYVKELKDKGYNVATFQFQGVNAGDKNYAQVLNYIYKYTVQSFNKGDYSLAFMFASELAMVFGDDYAKDITFVGHSCGGFISTATNYMLQAFYHNGKISNKHLIASRMVIEDPYVDTFGDSLVQGSYLMGTNEIIGDRKKCEVVQDMMISLHKTDNVAIDVYLGMAGASSTFIDPDKSHIDMVKSHITLTDMTGLKEWKGVLGDIHVLTRDWVWTSMFQDTLKDQDGNLAPSAACTNEQILSLCGNLYQQQNKKFNFSDEVLKKVSDTSEFKFS